MSEPNLPEVDPEAAISELASRLGYPTGAEGVTPRTPTLMEALTHKSYTHEHASTPPHNERLEFLGDAVLGLVVGQALMEAHRDVPEGQLSRMRAGLVNARRLADEARALGLGPLVRMGRGEIMTGGRDKHSILADAFEAVVAAIYLDLGMEPARRFILEHLGPHIEAGKLLVADQDFKTAVQEVIQARHQTTPIYKLVGEEGPDHAKHFTIQLWVGGECLGEGSGRSKKLAERAAAQVVWTTLQANPELLS